MQPKPSHSVLITKKINKSQAKWLFLKYFLGFFLLLNVVFFGINLPVYFQYENGVKERLLAQEEASVASATQMFQREMYELLHLLDLIIKSYTLEEYLTEGTPEQGDRLEKTFQNISTSFHRFDQIRLLNNSGHEQIRVNLVDAIGTLVPDEELQDKSERYYFRATQKMPLGQIYVSVMDLNVEQGILELPYKPTLRFSTPLKDSQGNPAGVLVINYLAKGMLVRFRQLMKQRADNQGMLLDNYGFWLSSRDPEREWGGDLNKPEQNFAKLFPEVWSEVISNYSGVFETKDGIYRYHNLEPLNFVDNQPAHFRIDHHPIISAESFANTDWKLVILLPRELINSHSFMYQPLGQILLGLFMLLIAGLSLLGAGFTLQWQLRKQKEQQVKATLEKQARIDELTGISNRRSFYELGQMEVKRALRQKAPLATLMIDADHFKKVNDTYGHAVGDLVLKDLTKTISKTLREIDLLGRVGGEEFAVLLPQTSLTQAQEVAERIRKALEERKVPIPKGEDVTYTVSIGLAMLSEQEDQLDKLLQKADTALYQAKEQGRNRVVSHLVS